MGNWLALWPQSLHSSLINQMPGSHPLDGACVSFTRENALSIPREAPCGGFPINCFLMVCSIWATYSLINPQWAILVLDNNNSINGYVPISGCAVTWANLIRENLLCTMLPLCPPKMTSWTDEACSFQRNRKVREWKVKVHGASPGSAEKGHERKIRKEYANKKVLFLPRTLWSWVTWKVCQVTAVSSASLCACV